LTRLLCQPSTRKEITLHLGEVIT